MVSGEVAFDNLKSVLANAMIDRLAYRSAAIRIAVRSYRIKGPMGEEGANAGAVDPIGG